MEAEKSLHAEVHESGMRLDRYLHEIFPDVTRSRFQHWIEAGCVSITGQQPPLKPSFVVKAGQQITVVPPAPRATLIEPQEVPFSVLYEDAELIVIHKPAGYAVHPGPEDASVTIASGLLHRWRDLPGHRVRPGIVHRLDKATEGVLLVARTEFALSHLSRQFHDRTVEKEYFAWVMGAPSASGTIAAPIGRRRGDDLRMSIRGDGRQAITHYAVTRAVNSRTGRKFSALKLTIETGRTHQIRVHLAHLGCPVVGDPLYSRTYRRFEKYGMMLLARRLSFDHPRSQERLSFSIDFPERFQRFALECSEL
ncbi:MAG: RluA family pseudouridine synthase [Spirochaetales bacterium]|nr:RluA family pseudouridine synthase [Spirochaetales bacterium]